MVSTQTLNVTWRINGRTIAALLLLLSSTLATAESRSWNFRVYLGDTPIGYQRFDISEVGGKRSVTTTARMQVKLLGITVYRYSHEASEQWQHDCLQSLSAQTNDNGTLLAVTTTKSDTDITAIAATQSVAIGICPMSFAYWNPHMLQQSHLLNSQTGEWQAVVIELVGEEKIKVRDGEINANHYRINGLKKPVELWYSIEGEWLALEAAVAGGRTLRYRLE